MTAERSTPNGVHRFWRGAAIGLMLGSVMWGGLFGVVSHAQGQQITFGTTPCLENWKRLQTVWTIPASDPTALGNQHLAWNLTMAVCTQNSGPAWYPGATGSLFTPWGFFPPKTVDGWTPLWIGAYQSGVPFVSRWAMDSIAASISSSDAGIRNQAIPLYMWLISSCELVERGPAEQCLR